MRRPTVIKTILQMENLQESIKNIDNKTITVLIKTMEMQTHLPKDKNKVPRLSLISMEALLELTSRLHREIKVKMIARKIKHKEMPNNLLIMVDIKMNIR